MPRGPARLPGTAAVLVAALTLLAAPAGAQAGNVRMGGTAYEFNDTDTVLAGATVRVVEHPRLRAVTRADGTYRLAVPDRAAITPYITAAGYHRIYLQTFRTSGEDLRRVNFQTPTQAVYRGLAALLGVPLRPDGELAQCAIVSTFSTRNVRDVGFRQFTGYGAHGVAGATAFTRPLLPAPIYFNDDVLPDRSQPSSSIDGGVIWIRVPAGVYRVRARHPATRFASFVATCAPGRVVNANPPWGLHQLGKPMPARVSARWSVRGARVRLHRLRAVELPRGAVVRIRCRGARCPFRRRAAPNPGGSSLDLLGALRRPDRKLLAGHTLDVRVSAHAYDAKVVRWRLRSVRAPRAVVLCVPLGNLKPRRHC
jgi:hypothetical protein